MKISSGIFFTIFPNPILWFKGIRVIETIDGNNKDHVGITISKT